MLKVRCSSGLLLHSGPNRHREPCSNTMQLRCSEVRSGLFEPLLVTPEKEVLPVGRVRKNGPPHFFLRISAENTSCSHWPCCF